MSDSREDRVPREVKGLSAVSLFNDFSSEMVYPVLPAFITSTLGGSPVALGALDGAAELTAAFVKWWSGRMADRPRWTKPLILIGYGLAIAIRPVIALAGTAWQVVGFRVVDRVGKGMRSPARDALISALTPPAARGRAFGYHRAADHLGAVLGSLAAWLLLRGGQDARGVIAWSIVPGIVVLLVLLVVLRGVRATDASARAAPDRGGDGADASGKRFWGPVLVLVLLTAGRLPETLLLLRMQDLGVSVAAIPLLWAALHVIRSGASYPGGWLADRLGVRAGVAAGAVLYAGVAAALAAIAGVSLGITVFLLYGVVAGLVEPAERVAITRLAPKRTGRGFGNYQGMAGLAALPAGLAFGAAYQRLGGPEALFISAGVVGLATALWIAVSVGHETQRET